MYIFRSSIYPSLGKAPEVRALLEAQVKSEQAKGVAAALALTVFGPDLGFIVNRRFDDLAAYESWRHSRQSDPAVQEYLAKVGSLSRQAPNLELNEVLIPFPR
ncbi:MAG TPA: hypothetical protein VFT91_07690 [Dehalococcoidia bacterium]|nr:hypothetical protein [Dehalococcoidia bacterium]